VTDSVANRGGFVAGHIGALDHASVAVRHADEVQLVAALLHLEHSAQTHQLVVLMRHHGYDVHHASILLIAA
jgi:hypothetical protein